MKWWKKWNKAQKKKKKYYPKQDNLINVINPYRTDWGGWVFDDADVDLKAEAFVAGADNFLTLATNNATNCVVTFSENPFPGFQYHLQWVDGVMKDDVRVGQVVHYASSDFGNYYYSEQLKMNVWFCPALFRYFKKAPKNIYAKIEYDEEAPKFVRKGNVAAIYDDFIEEYYADQYSDYKEER